MSEKVKEKSNFFKDWIMPIIVAIIMTAAIGFLTQRSTDQLANVTIMCDGQNVHE